MKKMRFGRASEHPPRAKSVAHTSSTYSTVPRDNGRANLKDYIETVTKSGPVKQWADMTPAERASVMATIRPPGVRE